jgi:hypothetical protein
MSSLVYLVAMSVKNGFFELLRKPAKLALYAFLVALVAAMALMSNFTRREMTEFQDIAWLQGAFFLFILLFAVIAVQKGLSDGDAIFGMDDVNLLFVSPMDSRPVLLYGIVHRIKTAFVAGFFLLFQSNSIGVAFGVGFDAILLLLCGFVMALVLLFTLSLLIYSVTNGRPARKTAAKVICAAALAPLAVHTSMRLLEAGDIWEALLDVIRSPVFTWTPVMGWTSAGSVGLIEGNVETGLLFLGLTALSIAAPVAYIAFSNPDYYEDVLVASETAFEKKRDLAEGRIDARAAARRKTSVAGTGVGGWGANSIFRKHLRESFRANRFGLWDMRSVLILLGAAFLSVMFARNGENGVLLRILQILMWMQIFLIGTGRGMKELLLHYIYLIPESSFSKIVWSNLEIVFRVFVEGVFIFGVAGAIAGEHPLFICVSALVYTLFSLLLISVNYLSMRWTGADLGAGFLLFLYTLAVMLIMLPGIVLAIVTGVLMGAPWGPLAGLGVLAVWELIAALVCFALSKGALHNCDMPVVRPKN